MQTLIRYDATRHGLWLSELFACKQQKLLVPKLPKVDSNTCILPSPIQGSKLRWSLDPPLSSLQEVRPVFGKPWLQFQRTDHGGYAGHPFNMERQTPVPGRLYHRELIQLSLLYLSIVKAIVAAPWSGRSTNTLIEWTSSRIGMVRR
jgi:hypothetical protein